jgi:hypothetical protein
MCAFFKRPLFVVSKMVVMARKSDQVPICGFDKENRMRTMKFISPKRVTENRCRIEKKAERIQ